jgi:hypothetical protein
MTMDTQRILRGILSRYVDVQHDLLDAYVVESPAGSGLLD